jgi:hypothetical protein
MITLAYCLIGGLSLLLTVRYLYLAYMRATWREMCVQYAFDSKPESSAELNEIASYMITTDMIQMVLEFWTWDFRQYVMTDGLRKMLDFYQRAAKVPDND